jgi:GNAT superfamily N-acetyltransferase
MCDERWNVIDTVEKLCTELLPEGYTLKVYDWNEKRFDIHYQGSKLWVAQFFLQPLAGCVCAAVLSYGSWIAEEHRGKGLGTVLLKIRTEAVKQSRYTLALATVRSDNLIEKKLLYRAGWRRGTTFPSTYSKEHHTQLWMYHPRGKAE